MAGSNRLRVLYLLHLSKPPHNRGVYRTIYRRKVRTILELGVGSGERAVRMIEAARWQTPARQIQYTGVDLFESGADANGLSLTLKGAHRLLQTTGAKIRLVPGDPFAAMARTANGLGPTDLVIVSAGLDRGSLDRAWFYLPRVLHPASVVLEELRTPSGELVLRPVGPREIDERSTLNVRRRAA